MRKVVIATAVLLLVGCDAPTRRLRGTWVMDPLRTLEVNGGTGITAEEVEFFTTNRVRRTFRKHELVDAGIFPAETTLYEVVSSDATSISIRCFMDGTCMMGDEKPLPVRIVLLDDNTHYIDGGRSVKECYVREVGALP